MFDWLLAVAMLLTIYEQLKLYTISYVNKRTENMLLLSPLRSLLDKRSMHLCVAGSLSKTESDVFVFVTAARTIISL